MPGPGPDNGSAVVLRDGVPDGRVHDLLQPLSRRGFVAERFSEGQRVGNPIPYYGVDDEPFLVLVRHFPRRYVGAQSAPVDALHRVNQRRFQVQAGLSADGSHFAKTQLERVLGLIYRVERGEGDAGADYPDDYEAGCGREAFCTHIFATPAV